MKTTPVIQWRNQQDIASSIGKHGSIVQWTIIRVPTKSFMHEAPYPVVIVDIDGRRKIGQLVDYAQSDLRKGRKVVAVLRKVHPEDPESLIAYAIKFKPNDR